jgi:hypothetical protein
VWGLPNFILFFKFVHLITNQYGNRRGGDQIPALSHMRSNRYIENILQDFIIDLNADMIWICYNEYWRLCRGTEY